MVTLDSVSVIENADTSTVQYAITVTNVDQETLYVPDPAKMGTRLFHYFTNGVVLRREDGGVVASLLKEIESPSTLFDDSWYEALPVNHSMKRSIKLKGYPTVIAGQYSCTFTYAAPKVEATDRVRHDGRVWLGETYSTSLNIQFQIEPAIKPLSDTNLIANSSFESDSTFTLEMWRQVAHDTTYITSSNDVPAGGGRFSVKVKGTGMPQLASGSISYELSPPIGTHRYRLSIWAKGYGGVGLYVKAAPTVDLRKSLLLSSSTWMEFSVLDTLTTTSSNTIVIEIGRDVFLPRNSYDMLIDLCRFERLD